MEMSERYEAAERYEAGRYKAGVREICLFICLFVCGLCTIARDNPIRAIGWMQRVLLIVSGVVSLGSCGRPPLLPSAGPLTAPEWMNSYGAAGMRDMALCSSMSARRCS